MTVRNKRIAMICAVLIMSAGGSAGYWYYCKQPQAAGPDPAQMNSEQIHTYMQSQDFNSLPRQQRRTFFEKVIDARAQAYFNTPLENRPEYLDKIIDEMQKFREDNPQRPGPNRMQRQQRNDTRTPEERRLGRETRDPVKNAMRREFSAALHNRAQERGIQIGRRGF